MALSAMLVFYEVIDVLVLRNAVQASTCDWLKVPDMEVSYGSQMLVLPRQTLASCKDLCQRAPGCNGIQFRGTLCTAWRYIRFIDRIIDTDVYYCGRGNKYNKTWYFPPGPDRPKKVTFCEDARIYETCSIGLSPQKAHPIIFSKSGSDLVAGNRTQTPSPRKEGYVEYAYNLRYTAMASDNQRSILCRAQIDTGQNIDIFRQELQVVGNMQKPIVKGPSSIVTGSNHSWSCFVDGGSQEAPVVTWNFDNGTEVSSNLYTQTVNETLDEYRVRRYYVKSTVDLTLTECDVRLQCYAEAQTCADNNRISKITNHEIATNCSRKSERQALKPTTDATTGPTTTTSTTTTTTTTRTTPRANPAPTKATKTLKPGEKSVRLPGKLGKSMTSSLIFLGIVVGALILVLGVLLIATHQQRKKVEQLKTQQLKELNTSMTEANTSQSMTQPQAPRQDICSLEDSSRSLTPST